MILMSNLHTGDILTGGTLRPSTPDQRKTMPNIGILIQTIHAMSEEDSAVHIFMQ